MNSKELRQHFIDYFVNKQKHTFIRSSAVAPMDDPTLLFTNAGMNQFKNIFLGEVEPSDTKVVNSQKCIRVSGKHNDLEEVGVDNFHHTFFEMLGNWSFGDYYKKEAITWAWEYLTDELKLDKSRLWVTVYKDDSESESLWKEVTDISPDRVLRFGDKDNFWEMGDTGPCGPCTEIHYFVGDDPSKQSPSGVNSEDLYREIWNLVFIQYNRTSDGKLHELPIKHVDTGMGFERILSTVNGIKDHYETDLFKPIINKIEEVSSVKVDTPHRVIADHLRMLSFSIADGVMPSNEGRGYVLRRVLRRASRYGRILNLKDPFIFNLVDVVVEIMSETYPELIDKRDHIKAVIKSEETSFLKTLDKGIHLFDEIASNLDKDKKISGKDAFKLYDTYGFPIDLTLLLAKEKEISVDMDSFESEMNKQKNRARKFGKFSTQDEEIPWTVLIETEKSDFRGYEQLNLESNIVKYRKNNDCYEYVLDQTPFYAESGGQVGDTGLIYNDSYEFNIIDTIKINGESVHVSKDFDEKVNNKNQVKCSVEPSLRRMTRANHTATHLLHSALKIVLGSHVQQAGSLVDSERLRFDLTHYNKISDKELEEIETIVNDKIQENITLDISLMNFDDAKESGAIAMFNEKYDEEVRVVDVVGFSKELCGGTHVGATGEIRLFKIISEGSLSTGVRRIEAVTGNNALAYLNNLGKIVSKIKKETSCGDDEVFDRVQKLISDSKSKDKEINRLLNENQQYRINYLIENSLQISNHDVIISKEENIFNLKEFGDKILKTSPNKTIAVIGTILNEKPMLLCVISNDLTNHISAKEIISSLSKIIMGGGGGKDSLATAGGKDASKLDEALKKSQKIIEERMNERL